MNQFVACVCLLCAFGLGAMLVVVSWDGVWGLVVWIVVSVVAAGIVLSVIRHDRRKHGPM